MKASVVLASALLSALAAAAPVHKRDLVYKTETVTEVLVVYTTVYVDDDVPEATATPEGYFYEQPQTTVSSAVVAPTYSAAPAPAPQAPAPKEEKPSSAPVAKAPTPTPTPTPSPTPAPAPAPVVEQPKEEPKPAPSVYVAPAPAPAPSSAPAPAPAAPSPAPQAPSTPTYSSGSGSGASFTDVDVTVYDNNGGFGACGTALHDTDMVAAIAKDAWNAAGGSTYDVMTGKATNPWCGQKINISIGGGEPLTVTIMDLCPGCTGHDIDLSWAAWKKAANTNEATRLKGSWSKA